MNHNPQMFMKRVGPFSNPHQQRQKIYNHPYMENTRIYEVSVLQTKGKFTCSLISILVKPNNPRVHLQLVLRVVQS